MLPCRLVGSSPASTHASRTFYALSEGHPGHDRAARSHFFSRSRALHSGRTRWRSPGPSDRSGPARVFCGTADAALNRSRDAMAEAKRPAPSRRWIRQRPNPITARSTIDFERHRQRIAEARRSSPFRAGADERTGSGPRYDRSGLFVARGGRLHPGARAGGNRRRPRVSKRRYRLQQRSGLAPGKPILRRAFDPIRSCRFRWACRHSTSSSKDMGPPRGRRCARAMQPADMAHPLGIWLCMSCVPLSLRYLHVSRGIDCSASQVFVTSGYRHTLVS